MEDRGRQKPEPRTWLGSRIPKPVQGLETRSQSHEAWLESTKPETWPWMGSSGPNQMHGRKARSPSHDHGWAAVAPNRGMGGKHNAQARTMDGHQWLQAEAWLGSTKPKPGPWLGSSGSKPRHGWAARSPSQDHGWAADASIGAGVHVDRSAYRHQSVGLGHRYNYVFSHDTQLVCACVPIDRAIDTQVLPISAAHAFANCLFGRLIWTDRPICRSASFDKSCQLINCVLSQHALSVGACICPHPCASLPQCICNYLPIDRTINRQASPINIMRAGACCFYRSAHRCRSTDRPIGINR